MLANGMAAATVMDAVALVTLLTVAVTLAVPALMRVSVLPLTVAMVLSSDVNVAWVVTMPLVPSV